MQKWEYRLVKIESEDKTIKVMNKLGDDGWEVFSYRFASAPVNPISGNPIPPYHEILLKRPKTASEPNPNSDTVLNLAEVAEA